MDIHSDRSSYYHLNENRSIEDQLPSKIKQAIGASKQSMMSDKIQREGAIQYKCTMCVVCSAASKLKNKREEKKMYHCVM
mmetsp:Transcript_31955/g.77541  ORF Transcript_31955/g.77541 Transcript_31955/m.77541 type:complete len:80 (+) Transcript_31955:1231-1470(+)